MLSGEAYVGALALRSITIQTAQLLGFVAGGALVGFINPYVALTIDSGTFLLSAVLVRFGVPYRRAPQDQGSRRPFWSSSLDGARLMANIPGLRSLFVLGMLAGLYIAPEGLAAAWVHELGAPQETIGLIMAGPPAGLVFGAWLFTKVVGPEWRQRVVGTLAGLAGVALAFCALKPNLWVTVAILVLSGMFTAYQVQVGASFGRMTPTDGRAAVMGLLNSGVLTVQGFGVLLAGALAETIGVARTVGVAGAVGALVALGAGLTWSRASQGEPSAEEARAAAA
jgi:hypothetical protein